MLKKLKTFPLFHGKCFCSNYLLLQLFGTKNLISLFRHNELPFHIYFYFNYLDTILFSISFSGFLIHFALTRDASFFDSFEDF